MSLSGALGNALSGLTANSRAATIVSSNIANAMTEGYGRRELALASDLHGTHGGVRIAGVTRIVDPVILADRRLSDAQLGHSGDMQTFAKRIEDLVGASDDSGSLTGRLSALENALTSAAANPAETQRLEAVATTAQALTSKLNAIADGVQQARGDADAAIFAQVGALNDALGKIDLMNDRIARTMARGGDVSTMLDSRQTLIDGLSEIVPLRVVPRERGEVALFTTSGAQLLDGRPAQIEFTATAHITADMSLGAGPLSGLSLNGKPVDTGSGGLFAGGSLAAQFQIRDETAPGVQARLDGLARDLAERFGAGGPDATILPGQPGLFTDGATAFDTLNEEGFANRIALNADVAPGSGGAWRLRDGLASIAPGEVGDARLLNGMSEELTTVRAPGSASLGAVSAGFHKHVANLFVDIGATRVRAEDEQSFAASQNMALRERELADGVDTDSELKTLMRIEQNYSANARVMSVVDDLMQRLMNI